MTALASRIALVATLGAVATGCANGGGSGTGSTDDWSSWGDAGPACGYGEHLCGGECVDDLPNEPENGCRRGCGDPCDAPDGVEATCSSDGRCEAACEAPYMRVAGRCECAPRTCEDLAATCGTPDDGCGGMLECGTCADGTACVEGVCSCGVDEAEENDVQAQAHELGEITDSPATEMMVDTYSLHAAGDVDWYRVVVHDGFNVSNPTVTVTLADAAPGYLIGAWYVCESGGDTSTCEAGEDSNYAGRGCTAATDGTGATSVVIESGCNGGDDSGVVLVRVMTEPGTEIDACAPYRLTVVAD
jgi:hypothetical protein